MANIDLENFIKHLQVIQAKYGNIPIEGNVICGERGTIPSLCVFKNDGYGVEELVLLVEIQQESYGSAKSFTAYEYPSMKGITLTSNIMRRNNHDQQ